MQNDKKSASERVIYDRIPFTNELFPIKIAMHSRTAKTPKSKARYSWHEQLEILYVVKGHVVCECDFTPYVCTERDIVIINPCEAHAVEYLDCDAYYMCLMVDPRLYNGREDISGIKYIDPMSEQKVRFNNVIKENERAREILLALFHEYENQGPAFEMAVKGNLLLLLSELFRNETSVLRADKKKDHSSISPALRYMSEHYSESISLDTLAKECFMNPSYFCRRFRAVTGKTAVSYLNEYRLIKAHSLLQTTDRSISDIACSTGFSDSNYFSRTFTRHYGVSPSVSRKRNRLLQEEQK